MAIITVYRNSTAMVHTSQSGVQKVTANGQFSSPGGIAVDSSGNVYVADDGNNPNTEIQQQWYIHHKVGFSGAW